jgi:hypothetical protein
VFKLSPGLKATAGLLLSHQRGKNLRPKLRRFCKSLEVIKNLALLAAVFKDLMRQFNGKVYFSNLLPVSFS